MNAGDRTSRLLAALVAVVAILLGAALAQRDAAPCACGPGPAEPIAVLPEVEVVATRLPP